ncbi:MAG: S24 family peptidase [Candidatus Kapaibacterium sp.]
MPNYSDLNTRQLYDLIFDYVTLQLSGFDKSDQLKQLKVVADNREDGLYDKALNEAMSRHIPYIPTVNDEHETPEYVKVLGEVLADTNYGIAEVSGDDMKNRGIHSGQHILYEKNRLPQNNDIVLVEYKNQVIIRNYIKRNDKIILSTSNSELADIRLSESVKYKVLGIVRLSINKI